MTVGTDFDGFPAETVRFLDELANNNNRPWFNENKARYERWVLEPALDFISAMGPRLDKVLPHFTAIPRRVGGSLMRVYRDTRFSRDKTPYKTNIGIQFRHELGKDVHAPGFYVHIDPDSCFLGAGIWRPPSGPLGLIRDRIVEDPSAWRAARDEPDFRRRFELAGDRLKRPPRGYPAGHPLVEDLKRKDFIAVAAFGFHDATETGFTDRVAADLAVSRPFMAFLCEALELAFRERAP